MSPSEAFEPLRAAMDQAGIRYAIGGSWASTAFGEPRFTHDVDILAELTVENLPALLDGLPNTFYVDPEEAARAVAAGRPFNIIHTPTVLKFDLFPSWAFPIGTEELDRAITLENSGLSEAPARFVTPEDIVLAKLSWFRLGGEVSEVQWRDVGGIVRLCLPTLDRAYLAQGAAKLGVSDLLDRALELAKAGAAFRSEKGDGADC
jgi:hypothetical protein